MEQNTVQELTKHEWTLDLMTKMFFRKRTVISTNSVEANRDPHGKKVNFDFNQ